MSSDSEYHSYHDLTLQALDGSTQIDHILLSPYGIFVIETKNYSGWIFGSERQKIWTQTIYGNKYKFQNPLHQNYKHIKAVQSLLNADIRNIISVVVFVGNGEFKTEMPDNVVELWEFLPYIKSHTQVILSADSLDKYYQMLINPTNNPSTSKSGHLRTIEQIEENPTCPRCGKQMVLRTARKGRGAGSEFWGCSGYPSCKATKNVA